MTTLIELTNLTKTDKELALTVATEEQMIKLIDRNVWDEDDFSRWFEAQENMNYMMAEFI